MTATARTLPYRPRSDQTDTPSDEVTARLPHFLKLRIEFGIERAIIPVLPPFCVYVGHTPDRETTNISPLRFGHDETGDVLAWDILGVAYGIGVSQAEAAAAWEADAREAYGDLQEHEPRLHPRLQRQLRFLRTYFG